jgi:2'-5' RNA ligase
MQHRIFIAINLPEKIKNELENLEKETAKLFPQETSRGLVRWIKKDNLHITLLFLGYLKEEDIPQICQIVKEISKIQTSFSLEFKKLLYGPPNKIPPSLIWVELGKNRELTELVEKLKQKVEETGILRKMDRRREFSPHITLGRIRTWQWQKIEPEERPDIEKDISLDFEVRSIEVMESRLKKAGAEYTILESIPLTL